MWYIPVDEQHDTRSKIRQHSLRSQSDTDRHTREHPLGHFRSESGYFIGLDPKPSTPWTLTTLMGATWRPVSLKPIRGRSAMTADAKAEYLTSRSMKISSVASTFLAA